MTEDIEGQITKVNCRMCKHVTNHKILNISQVKEKVELDQGLEDEWEMMTFLTAQCMGCETVCLIERFVASWRLEGNGELDETTTIYPDPYQTRMKVEGFHYLPDIVYKIYNECVSALNHKLPILSGIGLRAIVESICQTMQVTTGDLNQKINTLFQMGLITKQESELLHFNRFIGNAAAHELQEPEAEELSIGMDIIETALRNAYILPQKAKLLKLAKDATTSPSTNIKLDSSKLGLASFSPSADLRVIPGTHSQS